MSIFFFDLFDYIKDRPVGYKMTIILVTMISVLWGVAMFLQTPVSGGGGRYLPCPKTQPSKRSYEMFALCYTPIWISCFGMIVATGAYEHFTAWTYNYVCIGLAFPFLLQPILAPAWPDNQRRFLERYSTKVNVWIGIFSFIGNYWFTHYFYSILKARFTMLARQFNDVPIALYFATHFYFSTYHSFSNLLLRKKNNIVQGYNVSAIIVLGCSHMLFLLCSIYGNINYFIHPILLF
jgi:hypothetical protein